MSRPFVSAAVFAYNEEGSIAAALDRLDACGSEADLRVHVLVNGCTDGTERVVRGYQARRITVVPVVIAEGDKANAWNHYTHEVAPPEAAFHLFTDGDMLVRPGSITAFLRRFEEAPHANGCAGLPVSGRSRKAFRCKLVQRHEMAGNLYAVRGNCLMEFRRRGVRLPFGMFGEDGLVTALIKYDLDMRGRQDDARITAAEDAGFAFVSLSPWRPDHWRIYRKRKMRYAVRQHQASLIYDHLKSRGTAAMPAHVLDLYRCCGSRLRLRWNGFETLFDWVALRRIRSDIAAGDRVKGEERAHQYS